MRMGIISDLHVDVNHQGGKPILDTLLKVMGESNIDCMLIPGDMANDYRITLETLEAIQERSGISCYFVPGNHDIWNESHLHKSAWDIYLELQRFGGNLANGPVKLREGWALVGDMGWYDYSFGDQGISRAAFDSMQFESRVWQDKIKVIWDRSTVDMHRHFAEKLRKQLEILKGENLILVTHVVPHQAFTVQNPNPMWRYLNAFLGSCEYGQLALQHQVKYAVFGHVHYRKRITIANTTYVCPCLGTHDEWGYYSGKEDTESAVRDAFQVIELQER